MYVPHSTSLVLVRGISGAGKTTFCRMFAEGRDDVIMHAADDYMYKEGVYTFNPALLKRNHNLCLQATRFSLLDGRYKQVLVHNTFTTKKEMTPYYELASELSLPVFAITMNNVLGTVNDKDIQQHTLDKQKRRFQAFL